MDAWRGDDTGGIRRFLEEEREDIIETLRVIRPDAESFLEGAFGQRRQKAILDSGGRIVQQTRHFDAARGETADMRGKEDAEDYRFFPEPDLPEIVLSPIWVEQLRKTMPELPAAKGLRLQPLILTTTLCRI